MLETLEFTRSKLQEQEQFLDALRCTLIDESTHAPLLINGLLVSTDARILFISEEDRPEMILNVSYSEIINIQKGSSTANPTLLFATEKRVHHFINIVSTNIDYFQQITARQLVNT